MVYIVFDIWILTLLFSSYTYRICQVVEHGTDDLLEHGLHLLVAALAG